MSTRMARLLAAVLAVPVVAAAPPSATLNTITSVEVKDGVVEIVGTRRPNFTTITLSDPPRLVIDLAEATFSGVPESVPAQDANVTLVKTAAYGAQQSAIARVLIGFRREVETEIQSSGNRLVVRISGAGGSPEVASARGDGGPSYLAESPRGRGDAGAKVASAESQDAGALVATADDGKRAAEEAERKAQAEREARATEEKQRAQLAREAEERRRADAEAQRKAEEEKRHAEAEAKAGVEERRRQEEVEAKRRAEEEAKAAREQARLEKEAKEQAEREARSRRAAELAEQRAAAHARVQEELEARKRGKEEAKARVREAAEAKRRAQVEAREEAKAKAEARREQAVKDAAARKAEALARAKEAAEAKRQAQLDAQERAKAAAEAKAKAREEAKARQEAKAREEQKARADSAHVRVAQAELPPPTTRGNTVPEGGPRRTVSFVGFQPHDGGAKVFVRTTAPVRYALSEAKGSVVVELENAQVGSNVGRPLDTSFFSSPVLSVRSIPVGNTVRLEIRLRGRVPYEVSQDGNQLSVDFQRSSAR